MAVLFPVLAGLGLFLLLASHSHMATTYGAPSSHLQDDGSLQSHSWEKALYFKRLYLQEWESISRRLNESVCSYVNRFRRVLMDLRSQEVGLEAAFASETVGFRLLERCKLRPDQQRIVLVGSNQCFDYDAEVRKALKEVRAWMLRMQRRKAAEAQKAQEEKWMAGEEGLRVAGEEGLRKPRWLQRRA